MIKRKNMKIKKIQIFGNRRRYSVGKKPSNPMMDLLTPHIRKTTRPKRNNSAYYTETNTNKKKHLNFSSTSIGGTCYNQNKLKINRLPVIKTNTCPNPTN